MPTGINHINSFHGWGGVGCKLFWHLEPITHPFHDLQREIPKHFILLIRQDIGHLLICVFKIRLQQNWQPNEGFFYAKMGEENVVIYKN